MTQDIRQLRVPSAGIYGDASAFSDIQTEVLYGERVVVEQANGEWARVTTVLDGYPGYMHLRDLRELSERIIEPTHRVSEVVVPLYSRPDFKWPLQGRQLYMNSLVRVTKEAETPEGLMADVGENCWIFSDQLMPVGQYAPDFVAECQKFRGSGYEWGARSRSLVDCSALIQAGCIAAGIPCPRDAKPQAQSLGEPADYAPDFSNLVRGDLVFWTEGKGRHIVVMIDSTNCIHATIASPYRGVVDQPLVEVISDQLRYENGPVTGVRRIPGYRA